MKEKVENYSWQKYKKNLAKNTLNFIMEPSMVNDKILKEEVSLQKLSEMLRDKYSLNIRPEDIIVEEKLIHFGYCIVQVRDGHHIKYGPEHRLKDFEIELNFSLPRENVVVLQHRRKGSKSKASK